MVKEQGMLFVYRYPGIRPFLFILRPCKQHILRIMNQVPLVFPQVGATSVVHEILGFGLILYKFFGTKGVAKIEGAVTQLVGYNNGGGIVVNETYLTVKGHVASKAAIFKGGTIHKEEVKVSSLQFATGGVIGFYNGSLVLVVGAE